MIKTVKQSLGTDCRQTILQASILLLRNDAHPCQGTKHVAPSWGNMPVMKGQIPERRARSQREGGGQNPAADPQEQRE